MEAENEIMRTKQSELVGYWSFLFSATARLWNKTSGYRIDGMDIYIHTEALECYLTLGRYLHEIILYALIREQ